MEEKNTDSRKLVFKSGTVEWANFNTYSCIGGRPENQDAHAFYMMSDAHYQIFTVCDGMGGHAGGCVASETATTTLIESLVRHLKNKDITEAISTAVAEANLAVYNKAQDEPSLRGMGTTLTLLIINKEAAYITHVGDSRIYQLRNGRKVFRTFDHSMVFEQVSKGLLTEEEARLHPRSNILSKAIGILPDVELTVTKLSYHEEDRFILCSDGVWNSLPESELIEMFTNDEDLESMVKTVQASVERIGNKNGSNHDNHTMIAVEMLCDSDFQVTFFSKIKNLFSRRNKQT